MRKNFLILMLLSLLPLAGWAQAAVDISDGWSITLAPATANYNGSDLKPTVTLTKGSETLTADKFNVSWSAESCINVSEVGYTVTVTNNMTNTFGVLGTPTKTFWILKSTPSQVTAGELKDDDNTTAGNQVAYTGNPITLVKTAPVVKLDDVSTTDVTSTAVGGKILYSLNEQNWNENFPTATKVGEYHVYYKVEGTANYNGKASVEIGTITITGNSLVATTDYTAPQGKTGLAFQWNNSTKAAVAQELITAGTTPTNKGTMKYSLDGDNWSIDIPTASAAGIHRVYWMVSAIDGYYDVINNATQYVDVNIATVTPAVTKATAATGLVYSGEDQQLLSGAGSATMGAAVKYKIKGPGDSDFGAAIATLADVKKTNAGEYTIKTIVEAGGNYDAAEAAQTTTVTIATAPAFTSAPTAADVTWDATAHQLITAGAGTVAGKVQYKLGDGGWTTDITTITGTDGGDYTVKYKVEAENYTAVAETPIENVKIKGRPLSVKVNDLTKTYDGDATITSANTTVDGGGDRFTFITPLAGKNDFAAITAESYAAITAEDAKNAGPHADVVTVALATLQAVNTAKGYYYDYTIIPGKLTVEQKELYVTAKAQADLTTNMTTVATYTLGNKYDVTGIVGTEDPWATDGAPVLTSNAPSTIVPGSYDLSFTQGTLKTNGNYKMRTENPYVIAEGLKFIVNPATGSKVVITVLPHSKTYGDEDPNFASWVEGTDYYVSGLAAGDELQNLTFSRAAGETVADGPYALTATATVKNPTWYAEEIAFNNSTFSITAKELTATVDQQIVVVGATTLPNATAWNVTGLVDATINGVVINDTKANLGGTLAMSSTAATTTEGTITLAIVNTNYTLKAGTNVGKLIVIDNATLALNPNDANLVGSINTAAATSTEYKITFTDQTPATAAKTLTAGQWNTLVLPFNTTVAEVSAALGYAVVDVLDETNNDADAIKLKLAFGDLPAHKPFLVQPAATKKLSEVTYWNDDAHKKALVAVPAEIAASDGGEDKFHSFVGTYANYKVMPTATNEYFYSSDQKKFINSSREAGTTITVFGAYLVDNTNEARKILVEEPDGSTTVISTINNAEGIAVRAEGWYTLNGVKLQGVPTQKGIYINNGKKIVIK